MKNNQKRIGIDCRLWNETGIGRYIRNLIKELGKIETPYEYILFFRQEEFATVALPSKNFQKRLADVKWHTFEEQTVFKRILEKEQLDLVHFPYFSYPIWYKNPFVITIHDLILNHFPTGKASTLPEPFYWIKQAAYQFTLHQAVSHAEKIIAVSKATKQEILEHYHVEGKKIDVTYEGIDEELLHEKMEKVDIPSAYFLYVGNAYPHKNLERLVEGFALLNESVSFIFVGKEDFFYKRLKEKVIKYHLEQRIHFFQNISDAQLVYLYHHAKGVVLPSLMEGFGLPAIEAMANNCLVAASEIPAFLEVCGDAAVYFDPYSPVAIAKTLSDVLETKVHATARQKKGLQRAKEFSWKKMAQQTIAIYESCFSLRSC